MNYKLTCDEKKIQSFIYDNLKHLDSFIKNYEEIHEDETYSSSSETGSFDDFVKQFIFKNFVKSIRKFRCFSPIGKEIPVIKTGRRQLSIDILANNYETGEFFIIEIKRSYKTEREAVTEILAYANGLRSKFPELSTEDILIVIIARNWQPSLWNATVFLMLFFRVNIVPIQIIDLDYDEIRDEVRNISLEILIPLKKGNLTTIQNFTKKCFSSKVICWDDQRIQPREVANLVSIEMNRRNMHGFIVGLKSWEADSFEKGKGYPFPYGILISALNPYSIAKYRGIYANFSNTDREKGGIQEKGMFEDTWYFDVIRISDIFNQNSIESVSLDDLEYLWDNRLGEVTEFVYELFKHTDYKPEPHVKIEYLNFSQICEAGVSTLFEWIFINYTGLFHDFLLYRSILDWKIKEKQGYADVLFGDIGSSVFQTYYSVEYFCELIEWIFPSDEPCNNGTT